jgi:hypothetical protein
MKFEISYIGDYSYTLPEGIFVTEGDADYVKACHALVTHFSGDKPLKIWVRKLYHFTWLQQFCVQIHFPCDFVEKTARIILAETWNVTLPEWLKDEDIEALNLLELNIKYEKSCRFEEALLEHFLGTMFCGNRLDQKHINEVVIALARKETKELLDRSPLLLRCLQEQSKIWMVHADENWEKTLIASLINEPEILWQDLSLLSLLRGYPEKLLEYVVAPQRVLFLRSVPHDIVKSMPMERKAVEEASTQIEMFFKDIKKDVTSSDNFQKALQCISGRIIQEFNLLKEILISGQFIVNNEDIRMVREKFHRCPGLNAAEWASLNFLVMPQRPVIPEKGSLNSVATWIAWSVDAYIPYRYWQTKRGYFDHELEDVIQSYSDWYIREYETIHQDVDCSLVHALDSLQDTLQNDEFSLIVVADCLPLTFWSMFQDALQKAGFYRHSLMYRFVPLPTDTENVKPLLFSGSWNPLKKTYDAILQERAKNDWRGKKLVYLSNLKMLSEFLPSAEPTIVFLNLLAGDEILHKDMEAHGTTHEEELFRLFIRVGEFSTALLDRWSGTPEKFGIYIVTDHGACCVLEDEKQSFDSKIVTNLFADARRRFAVVDKGDVTTIPENLWAFGSRFVQPFTKEDKVFFIPRGHNTVRTSGLERGYVHGGATPEETIVPVAVFKPTKAAWRAPAGRFLDLHMDAKTGKAVFYIQRVTTIRIEMLNPNLEDVRIVRIAILKPDAEIKGQELPVIHRDQTTTISVDCYFNKPSLGQDELVLQFICEIAGDEKVMEMKVDAEFRSAVTGGFSLKDLK